MVFRALNESLIYLPPPFLPLTFDCFPLPRIRDICASVLLSAENAVPPGVFKLHSPDVLAGPLPDRPATHMCAHTCTHAHILPISVILCCAYSPPQHTTYRPQSIIHILKPNKFWKPKVYRNLLATPDMAWIHLVVKTGLVWCETAFNLYLFQIGVTFDTFYFRVFNVCDHGPEGLAVYYLSIIQKVLIF